MKVLQIFDVACHQIVKSKTLICRAGLGSMVVEDIKIPSKFVGLSKYTTL